MDVILRFVGIVPRKIDALTHLLASELLLQIIIRIIIRIMIIMLSKQINRTSGNYANGTAAYPSGSRSLLLLLLLSSVSSSSGKIPVALKLNRVRYRGYTYTTPFVTLKQTFFGSDENYYGFFFLESKNIEIDRETLFQRIIITFRNSLRTFSLRNRWRLSFAINNEATLATTRELV